MAHVKYWDENGNLISEYDETEQPKTEITLEERLETIENDEAEMLLSICNLELGL